MSAETVSMAFDLLKSSLVFSLIACADTTMHSGCGIGLPQHVFFKLVSLTSLTGQRQYNLEKVHGPRVSLCCDPNLTYTDMIFARLEYATRFTPLYIHKLVFFMIYSLLQSTYCLHCRYVKYLRHLHY